MTWENLAPYDCLRTVKKSNVADFETLDSDGIQRIVDEVMAQYDEMLPRT
jgi:hypothetical protein